MKLSKDIARHSGEFLSALMRGKFSVSDGGVYFPEAKQLVKVGVKYKHFINGEDAGEDENLVPAEGRIHALGVALGATVKNATWYVAPYTGNATPIDSWTAANFNTNATESVSNTEGYSETTRRAFVPGSPSSSAISNAASRASFTIATAGASITFYGLGLLSTNTKGDTAGILISAARFAAPKIISNADVWGVEHSVTASST